MTETTRRQVTAGRSAAGQGAAGQAAVGQGAAGQSRSALVVGLGSPDRGDDGIGPAVARCVATLALAEVDVLVHEDPADLVELWSGRSVAVVVDAVCSGGPAGTVHLLETEAAGNRLFHPTWADTARGGTHALGLATAVELARVLHRLPRRLVVVGIEGVGFDRGAPLSPQVQGAMPAAVAAVVAALARAKAEGVDDVPR